MAQEIVALYLEHTPILLDDLQDALETKDTETVTRLAHSLKSSSGQLGATKLSQLSWELELLARQGHLHECLQHLALIEQEYTRVHRFLNTRLKGTGSGKP